MSPAHGATVLTPHLPPPTGEAIARELGGAFVKCAVSQEADAQAVVAKAVSLGKLMGLVNCAGIGPAMKTLGKEGAGGMGELDRDDQESALADGQVARMVRAELGRRRRETKERAEAPLRRPPFAMRHVVGGCLGGRGVAAAPVPTELAETRVHLCNSWRSGPTHLPTAGL